VQCYRRQTVKCVTKNNGYVHKFYECVIRRAINKFNIMEGQHCDSPNYKYSVAKLFR
jgi:hypothetical protein